MKAREFAYYASTPPYFITQDDQKRHDFIKTLGKGLSGTAYLFSDGLVIKEFINRKNEMENEVKITSMVFEGVGYSNINGYRMLMPYTGVAIVRDLFPLLKNNLPYVIRFFKAMLEIYSDLHKKNICHNDFAKQNFTFDNTGKMHLIDFGESKLIARKKDQLELDDLDKEIMEIASLIISEIKFYIQSPKLSRHTVTSQMLALMQNLSQSKITEEKSRPADKVDATIKQMDVLLNQLNCKDHSTSFVIPLVKQQEQKNTQSILLQSSTSIKENKGYFFKLKSTAIGKWFCHKPKHRRPLLSGEIEQKPFSLKK